MLTKNDAKERTEENIKICSKNFEKEHGEFCDKLSKMIDKAISDKIFNVVVRVESSYKHEFMDYMKSLGYYVVDHGEIFGQNKNHILIDWR